MIKVNKRYLIFLAGLLGLYFLLLWFMPQKFNWFISLYQKDKNPFGTYVFKTLIDDARSETFSASNKSIYELKDAETPGLFILCQNFSVSGADLETLFNLADQGKTIFISAHQMDTVFTDSLGARLNNLSFSFYLDRVRGEDSTGVKFNHQPFDTSAVYWLPTQMLSQYFESFDPERAQVLAENTDGMPVLLRFRYGDGNILLSATPMLFTNYSMLVSNNNAFVSGMISYLPNGPVHWTEFYQMGRMEATTPLRYILSEPSLKWALYITMISVLLLMVFEAKRKQRVIPIIIPLRNETPEFVKTIANLYYSKKDHKDLASKKILHLTEYLRQQLQIDLNEDINVVLDKVVAKTQSEKGDVKKLFDQINYISSAKYISAAELKLFTERSEHIFKK